MVLDRFVRVPAKLPMVAVLVVASLGTSACATTPQLPDEARDALVSYWESLPSYLDVENRISRAWPGDAEGDLDSGALPREIWCVEAAIYAADDPSVDGELLVWIVTRENREARWSAALLASLSSLWPYQACGVGPG